MELNLENKKKKFDKYEDYYTEFKKHCIWSRFFNLPQEIKTFFEEDSIITENAINIIKEYSPDVFKDLTDTIDEWERVVPFLDKSPKDASFFIPDMKCLNLSDVFTLLKASNRVNKNSNRLILKKWYSLPETEFRVFFIKGKLKAISQRNINQVLELNDKDLITLKKIVIEYFIKVTKLHKDPFDNCFIDVIVYLNSGKLKFLKVKELTYEDTLLYTLEELEKLNEPELNKDELKEIELPIKVVENQEGITSEEKSLFNNRFPIELEEYGANTIDELINKINNQ